MTHWRAKSVREKIAPLDLAVLMILVAIVVLVTVAVVLK